MIERRRWLTVSVATVVALGGVLFYRWWMRPPAIEFDNLKYVQLLTTAVSSRSPEWLGKVEQAVQLRHQAGEMSDVELKSLARIIQIAEAGDWATADLECFALAEAQLNRRRSRPAVALHDHEH